MASYMHYLSDKQDFWNRCGYALKPEYENEIMRPWLSWSVVYFNVKFLDIDNFATLGPVWPLHVKHAHLAPPRWPSRGDICLGQIAVSSEEGREVEGGGRGLVRVLFNVEESGQLACILIISVDIDSYP